MKHEDDSTLLRAYIGEWSKFFTQCNYLPKPFGTLESNLQGKAGGGASKRPLTDGITVQKVKHFSVVKRMKQLWSDNKCRVTEILFFGVVDVG